MQRPGHTQQPPRARLAPRLPRLHIIVLRWLEGRGGGVQICRGVGAWRAWGDDSGRSPRRYK